MNGSSSMALGNGSCAGTGESACTPSWLFPVSPWPRR